MNHIKSKQSLILCCFLLLTTIQSCDQGGSRIKLSDAALEISVDTIRTFISFDVVRSKIISNESFRTLSKNKIEWLDFQPRSDVQDDQKDTLTLHKQMSVYFYDYSNEKAYRAVVGSKDNETVIISELDYQPRASEGEFVAAQRILADSLGSVDGREFYLAMPSSMLNKQQQRSITIGVHSKRNPAISGVYSVSIIKGYIDRINDLYHVDFTKDLCEIASSTTCSTNGDGEQVRVTIRQGTTILWRFYAVRPQASSGHPGKGSGVELRHVYYRGKQVLYRAHVPILNVRYDQDVCGPYRDWQNQETCFDCALGTDYGGTGFRKCKNLPKTFADDLDDSGDFKGVGIYVNGLEVIFVSELAAGWYRYTSDWTFHADGTLKPRFKFGGTQNSCTCSLHSHHVYWRLDFDIEGASNNSVKECKKVWWGWKSRLFEKEGKSFRDSRKKWRVENDRGDCYDIIPGSHDGNGSGDAWAKGDVWVVRYHYDELEDGVSCVYCSGTTATIQDNVFLTGENVKLSDVVIWYRSSFDHDAGHTHDEEHQEIVGPDIKPIGGY